MPEISCITAIRAANSAPGKHFRGTVENKKIIYLLRRQLIFFFAMITQSSDILVIDDGCDLRTDSHSGEV